VVEHADAFVEGQKPSDRATVVLSQGLVKEPAGTSWARLNVASKPRHQSFDCWPAVEASVLADVHRLRL